MPTYTTAEIRNVALLGSAGSGKTTLLELMLQKAGVIGRAGRVEDGNTVCDFEDLEKEVGITASTARWCTSTSAARTSTCWTRPGCRGLPGPGAKRAAGGGDGGGRHRRQRRGSRRSTRRVMKAAGGEPGCPRMIIINKIDNATWSSTTLLANACRRTFGSVCRPDQPARRRRQERRSTASRTRRGHQRPGRSSPDFHTGPRRPGRGNRRGLDGDSTSSRARSAPEQLASPDQGGPATRRHLVPICFTSATRRTSASRSSLEIMTPSCARTPTEGNPLSVRVPGRRREEDRLAWTPIPDKSPVLAHVFKRLFGPVSSASSRVFRVHQGHDRGRQLQPHRRRSARRLVRMGHIFKLQGKDARGDRKGDRLGRYRCRGQAGRAQLRQRAARRDDMGEGIRHLVPLPGLPKPMFGLAIEGTSKGAETKMGEALRQAVGRGPDPGSSSGCRPPARPCPPRPRRAAPENKAAASEGPLRRGGGDAAAEGRLQGDDHRQGRGAPSPQEADRRRRPVRRGLPACRAGWRARGNCDIGERMLFASTTRSAGRSRSSSCPRSRRACAACHARTAPWPAIPCRT